MRTDSTYTRLVRQNAAISAEELARINLPNKRTELVRGQLVVREPAGQQHGYVAMEIGAAILQYVKAHTLGVVYAAETGFTLFRNPDTVRAPDVAFVRTERIPDHSKRGFAELAPDLAVEVLSPDDTKPEVRDKVADWLEAGARLVWVIDPWHRDAHVYRADGTESHITTGGVLDGADVLPGFTYAIADLF